MYDHIKFSFLLHFINASGCNNNMQGKRIEIWSKLDILQFLNVETCSKLIKIQEEYRCHWVLKQVVHLSLAPSINALYTSSIQLFSKFCKMHSRQASWAVTVQAALPFGMHLKESGLAAGTISNQLVALSFSAKAAVTLIHVEIFRCVRPWGAGPFLHWLPSPPLPSPILFTGCCHYFCDHTQDVVTTIGFPLWHHNFFFLANGPLTSQSTFFMIFP